MGEDSIINTYLLIFPSLKFDLIYLTFFITNDNVLMLHNSFNYFLL